MVGYFLWLNESSGELWREGDVVSTFPAPVDLATGDVHHAQLLRFGARLMLTVNNRLLLDFEDPVPLAGPLHSRVGFGRQWGDASALLCGNVKLRRPALSSEDQSALATVPLLPEATIPPAKNMDVLFKDSAADMMDASWLHSQPQHSVLCDGNKLVLLPDNASPAVLCKTPIKGDFAFDVTFEYVPPVFPQPERAQTKSRAENWLRAGDKELNLFLVVAYDRQFPPPERFANFYEEVPTGWEAGIPIGTGENVLCWTGGRERECLAEMPYHAPVAGRKYTARLERHGDIVRLFLDGVYLLSAQQSVPLADPDMPAFLGVRQVFCGAVVHEVAAYRIVADESAKDDIVSTPDRKPAEWVLGLGGTVNVKIPHGGWRELKNIGEIPKGVFRIEWINLNDNQQVTDEAIKNIATLSSIRELALARTPISDAGLRHIRGLIGLKKLDLLGTPITDAALQEINSLKNLKILNLNETEITDRGLTALQDLKQLEELHLWMCKNVGDQGMQYLKGMPRLRWLNMEGSQVGDNGVAHLSQLKALQVLGLGATRITDAGLEKINTLMDLKTLNLSETQVTDRGLAALEDMTELEELGLRHCTQAGDRGAQYLRRMLKLRSLDVSYTRIGDNEVASVSDLTSLERLGLAGTRITDAGLEEIAPLKDLSFLDLNTTEITDRGLAVLQDKTQLEELNVCGCAGVGDDGMQHLNGMSNLRRLALGNTRVGDSGIARLSTLKELQFLDLAATKVTDAAAPDLAAFPKLDDLNLAQTSVTDHAMEQLKAAMSLRSLNVTGTQVTKEGIRQFRLARPDCAVTGP
jgi:Leucine-rich repeat (LRR) protein